MGRDTTGATTAERALRIELSYLIKNGRVKKGCEIHSSMNWTNGSSIRIETSYNTDKGNYIRLIYTNTDSQGNKTNHDDKIYLSTMPSNLGKGVVLYFICPVTHQNCRLLYCCYGSDIWKSRLAYRNRIYYQSQMSSKMDYWINKYWKYERLIKKLESDNPNRTKQLTYNGIPTKFSLRILKLKRLRDQAENRSFTPACFPLSLRKALFKF